MHYSLWATKKIGELEIPVTQFIKDYGLGKGGLNTAKRFDPTSANLVILCECLNEARGGNQQDLDMLLLEAIRSTRTYQHAAERIAQRTDGDKKQ